ncbi:hypothetical protein ACQ4LE_002924 [Meloidogyne hapla]
MSEAEERFLRLPDSADYTRVRQFNIDAKGAVISRGDSFRRKRINKNLNEGNNDYLNGNDKKIINDEKNNNNNEEQQYLANERSSTRTSGSSASGVNSSNRMGSPEQNISNYFNEENNENNIISTCIYKICVLGEISVGKSSLISQFISSSAYSDLDDVQDSRPDGSVSVNIGGHECELKFLENDLNEMQNDFSLLFGGDFHLFLIVYSIDRKISFRIALKAIEQLRSFGCSLPIILVGNKADLERKRAVMENDVKNAMYTFDVAHFEISVALNHDVDDLLVGIVAQIKDSFQMNISTEIDNSKNKKLTLSTQNFTLQKDSNEDFQAAIRRFSRRKKRQMHVNSMEETGKCLNLFTKLKIWRKGSCS